MLSQSRYSGDGHAWNSVSDIQLGSLWGGVRIFGRGVRKKGGSDEPPEPPWLRACTGIIMSIGVRSDRFRYAYNINKEFIIIIINSLVVRNLRLSYDITYLSVEVITNHNICFLLLSLLLKIAVQDHMLGRTYLILISSKPPK